MDVWVDWNRVHSFHLQVMGLNTARGWEVGSSYPWAAVWGLNDMNWWCDTSHWDRDPSREFDCPACTASNLRALLLQNVVSGDSSVDKGMFPHSRNTLDGWLTPCPPGMYEEWLWFGGAVHLHNARALSAIFSEDGKSQQRHNLSNGCASIRRRTSWKFARWYF